MRFRTLAAAAALLPLAACQWEAAPAAEPTHHTVSPHHHTRELPDLHIAAPTDDGTYDRYGDFGGWIDADHNGCPTRDQILARDMTNVVTDDGCDVKSGTLQDLYTGRTIDFTDSAYWTVQIDHIYPLHLAYEMGAEQWSHSRRVAFANDPANLLAVDAHSNMSKGDSGPGEWLPIDHAGACTYGRKYVSVATKYALPITQADHDSLRDLFATC